MSFHVDIDYLPLEEELEFSPNEENSTKCVLVTVFDDLDVEGLEQFNVVVSSQTDGVTTLEGEQRATVSIRDEDGKVLFCFPSTNLSICRYYDSLVVDHLCLI